MAKIETWFTQDLNTAVKPRSFPGEVFNNDSLGNLIGVEVTKDGEPFELTGSVNGYCVLSNGETIPVAGTRSGNKASIVLPQTAYSVRGVIKITLKLTNGNETTTLLQVVGAVDQSVTGNMVNPGSVVQDWSQQIAAALQELQDAEDNFVRVDTDSQGLTDTKKRNGRTNIDAVSVADVDDFKSAVSNGMSAIVCNPLDLSFDIISGGLTNVGDSTSNNKRARTTYITTIVEGTIVGITLDNPEYVIINAVAYLNGAGSDYFSRNFYSIDGNHVVFKILPTEKRIRISFAHVNKDAEVTNEDISNIKSSLFFFTLTDAGLSKFGIPADAQATGQAISDLQTYTDAQIGSVSEKANDLNTIIDRYFVPGNNLVPLFDYETEYRGVTVSVKNGIVKLTGTSTGDFRAKMSNGYDVDVSVQDSWKAETLSQFEIGKTYSLHNIIISGELPSSAGVSIRGPGGGSVISISTGNSTLDVVPAFAMLYIKGNITYDVSFVPVFIEGTVDDAAYYKTLWASIGVDQNNYATPDFSLSFIYDANYESAMKFPTKYKPYGEPTPLIILAHGLSSTITSDTWGSSSNMIALVNKFVQNGYAVIDVNRVTSQDWVNPDLIQKYVSAINYAVKKYNVIPKIVFGESMGSMIGLCLSTLYSTVRACVISGIRLDMAARYSKMTQAQKEIVNTNLGFPAGTVDYIPNIAAGWDKTAITLVDTNENKVCPNNFPPTFFIVGDADDGELATKQASLAKIEEIKLGGTICKTQEYSGDHTAVCYLLAGNSFDDALAWFKIWN